MTCSCIDCCVVTRANGQLGVRCEDCGAEYDRKPDATVDMRRVRLGADGYCYAIDERCSACGQPWRGETDEIGRCFGCWCEHRKPPPSQPARGGVSAIPPANRAPARAGSGGGEAGS